MVTKNKEYISYERTLGMSVMEGKGFYYPNDTAFSKNGKTYVLNRSLEIRASGRGMRVNVCDTNDEYYGSFGKFGDEPGQFMWPSAICVDQEGRVFISDEHLHKIMIFSEDGTFIDEWGKFGHSEGEMDAPSGLTINRNNELLVSDTYNNRIQVFTLNGTYLRSFGDTGTIEQRLNMPWRLTEAPSGDIYVADWGNDRVVKFDSRGQYLQHFGKNGTGEGEFIKPAGVAVDKKGRIYVCDWGNERLQVLDSDGHFLQLSLGESGISPWAQNFLNVNVEEGEARAKSNLEKSDIEYFDASDRNEVSAHIEKYFWSPMSVVVGPDNRVYVTESNRHRIQVFSIN